jgi:hypothetical protein
MGALLKPDLGKVLYFVAGGLLLSKIISAVKR